MLKPKDCWTDHPDDAFAKTVEAEFSSPKNVFEHDVLYDMTADIPVHIDFKFKRLRQLRAQFSVNYAGDAVSARGNAEPSAENTAPIEVAPGFRLHRFLGTICTKSFTRDVLDQLLADGTVLYQERLATGDKWGAIRVRWAMRGWLLHAALSGAAGAIVSMVWGWRKSSK